MEKITANWTKLMEDGFSEADTYFAKAINTIDSVFGEGYAKEHPELIGAFMNAATRANQSAVIGKCLQELAEELTESLDSISGRLHDISEEMSNLE